MMLQKLRSCMSRCKDSGGFTLTEMLAATLVMAAMSAMLATGVPVAIDSYQKTVNTANAQVALSTTTTALRRELSLAADVRVDPDDNTRIYYLSRNEGCWICIAPADSESDFKGLVKCYLIGVPDVGEGLKPADEGGMRESLIPNETIPADLTVTYGSVESIEDAEGMPVGITVNNLRVCGGNGQPFATVDKYSVLTRFEYLGAR